MRGVKGNVKTDAHGIRILEERVDKDEVFSLPTRELTAVQKEREAEVIKRGKQRQRLQDPRVQRKLVGTFNSLLAARFTTASRFTTATGFTTHIQRQRL